MNPTTEPTVKKYYLSLDVLYDTRLGVLSTLDLDHTKKIINDPQYYARRTDYFKSTSRKFKAKDYDLAWSMRDLTTLKNSTITKIVEYILDDALEQVKEPSTRFIDVARELIVDIHPYQLTHEQQTIFIDALKELFPIFTKVELVTLGYQRMTPEHIKQQNFTFCYMYDFQAWLNYNYVRLENCRIPQHYLIFPELLNREIPESADATLKQLAEVISPNKAMELFAMEHMLVSLRFEPVEHFSINVDLLQRIGGHTAEA